MAVTDRIFMQVSMSSGTPATSTDSPLGEAGAKADASLRLRESPLLQPGRDASVMNARAAQFSGLLDITGCVCLRLACLVHYERGCAWEGDIKACICAALCLTVPWTRTGPVLMRQTNAHVRTQAQQAAVRGAARLPLRRCQ